jgi:phosphatidate cytidylyltransferase
MSRGGPAAPGRFGDLGLRILSSIGLALLVSVDLWLGGAWVSALAAIAAALMLWELHRMATGNDGRLAPGLAVPAVGAVSAVFVTSVVGVGWGALVLAAFALATLMLRRAGAGWMAAGLAYVGLAMAYVTVLRDGPGLGLAAIVWLIVVVAAADIGAYFAGRTLGGPKLWPRVSPKKTWSGALGGLGLGVAFGLGTALAAGWPLPLIALLSAGVVVASQAGDLLESSVKRHFAVKDASQLIPGHGGVMDRLDGVVGGLWFIALFDILGGSLDGSLGG